VATTSEEREVKMAKYRKKPVVVEVWQFLNDADRVRGECHCGVSDRPHVHTMHDGQFVNLKKGDWITPDGKPETYYPIKPDIFAATYEPADAPPRFPREQFIQCPNPECCGCLVQGDLDVITCNECGVEYVIQRKESRV
jgi:hypothetical protein